MNDEGRACLIALLRVARRPGHVLAGLVEEAGDAHRILCQELEGEAGNQPQLFRDPTRPKLEDALEAAALDLARWRHQGIQPVTVLDPEYPLNLRRAHDRPPLLFVRGRLHPADARAVAVIGSRAASPGGMALGGVISARLGSHTYTVFSGLATGIDTAAHRAALERGARTVAVLGTGLLRSYPPENAPLQRTIAERGAVVSQFWPEAPPSRHSFPQRNAVMSGLTLATVIVEAGERSGARIQARAALAQGRPVILLPAVLRQRWAQELARRPAVHGATSAEEVVQLVDQLAAGDVPRA